MDVTDLNDEQLEAFKEFNEAIKDCTLPDSSDVYKLKWLIARAFNAAAAEKMLRKSLEWRKVNQLDTVLDWEPPEVMTKYFPAGMCGYDKFGCPVWIHQAGRADLRGLLQSVSRRDYQRYLLQLGEKSIREMALYSRQTGKIITQQTAIVDMEFLSMSQMTYKPAMEEGMESTKVMEANYPENLRRVFVINAPKWFTMIFGVIKPLMHPLTVDKFQVFGYNVEEWKAALLQDIDPDQLPAHYGGTQTDPDGNPMCLTRICIGGEVPRSYYLSKDKPQPRDNMKCVIVTRGSKKKFEFQVSVPNSALKWEFLTLEGDIAFHVYRIDGASRGKDSKATLVPSRRVDSHVCIEEGVVVCTQQATYVAVLDNSFSYLRSKTVWYAFDVEEPAAESPTCDDEEIPLKNNSLVQ